MPNNLQIHFFGITILSIKILIIAYLLVSFLGITVSGFASAIFTSKDENMLEYYRDPLYIKKKQIEILKKQSTEVFKRLRMSQRDETRKIIAMKIKNDPWKKLNLEDDARLKNALLDKVIGTGGKTK